MVSASDKSLDFPFFISLALSRSRITCRDYPIQVRSFFLVTYHYDTSVCHLTESDESVFVETVVSIIDSDFKWVVKYGRRILEGYIVLLQTQRRFLSIPNKGQHQASLY